MYAIDYGSGNIVKMLIAAKADVNLRDKNRKTALTKAIDAGYGEIAKQLVDVGATR
jgi:ankyrin repeat protein